MSIRPCRLINPQRNDRWICCFAHLFDVRVLTEGAFVGGYWTMSYRTNILRV